jgi:prepilin-type processing-associated H-X9-DG protein
LPASFVPAFASARVSSTRTICLKNLAKLGAAFAMYEEDTDNALPRWYDNLAAWDTYLLPFAGNKRVFTCPAVAAQYPGADSPSNPSRTYALPRNVSGAPLSRIPLPPRTVLLLDKGSAPFGSPTNATAEWFGQVDSYSDPRFSYPTSPGKWRQPHESGKNFLFVDGHAGWYRAIVAKDDTNPYGYAFGPFPAGLSTSFRYGYSGGISSISPTTGTVEWGANLPR